MKGRWEQVKNGYHKEWWYVDVSGRIVGGVSGSEFQQSDGWHAHLETPVRVNIGRFVTADLAKKAVEDYGND